MRGEHPGGRARYLQREGQLQLGLHQAARREDVFIRPQDSLRTLQKGCTARLEHPGHGLHHTTHVGLVFVAREEGASALALLCPTSQSHLANANKRVGKSWGCPRAAKGPFSLPTCRDLLFLSLLCFTWLLAPQHSQADSTSRGRKRSKCTAWPGKGQRDSPGARLPRQTDPGAAGSAGSVCLRGPPSPTSSLQKLFLAISSGNMPYLSTYTTAFSPRRAVKEDLHQYNPLLIPFPLLLSYLHYLQLRRGC